MQLYELLCIAPGTLSEDEVQPVTESVRASVQAAGADEIEMKNLGKSRLAYPIKHVRYGYFLSYRFQAESEAARTIVDTLRLSTELLRTVMRKTVSEAPTFERLTPVEDVLIRERTERSVADIIAPVTVEEETRQIRTMQPEPAVASVLAAKTETKAEDIKLDDIDKKLDEILGGDISNV